MAYILSFLEGVITFVSPCILPMFPIYLSYFAGSNNLEGDVNGKVQNKIFNKTLKNALGFTLGFTLVFVTLGAFAGTIGVFLRQNSTVVNIVTGSIVILFGLHFIGIFNISFLNKSKKLNFKYKNPGFFSSILFGIVFSIGWTPCVGVFLGSALMLAASQGGAVKGIVLLLLYSLGLALPFILSAILIDKLKGAFAFIKKHYKVITTISGIFLVIVGLLMIFGLMGYLLNFLTI